jgi:hypothetical protein
MYGGASWALIPERASANMKMGKNLGQNTRGIGISPCLTKALSLDPISNAKITI